ncbi:hypothetical protein BX070DRAFT_119697 [Coemansia spiralis]|nr:hypothetical protein BX070DRAFT_119697 [Coemansia spiralis]
MNIVELFNSLSNQMMLHHKCLFCFHAFQALQFFEQAALVFGVLHRRHFALHASALFPLGVLIQPPIYSIIYILFIS